MCIASVGVEQQVGGEQAHMHTCVCEYYFHNSVKNGYVSYILFNLYLFLLKTLVHLHSFRRGVGKAQVNSAPSISFLGKLRTKQYLVVPSYA